jgi:Cu/Ag efflux protein CusF
MLRTMFGSVVLATALVALPASAQTGAAVMGKAPGKVAMAQTVKATATITAIDAATRAVTLKGPKGNEMVVTAGPEVKNFAQLKVGDQVNIEFIESLALELKKGGGAPVAATAKEGAAAAKPGERPGMVGGRQVTVVADVIDLNAETQMVTLKGPQRTIEVKARDPEQFKLIKKGDQIQATYTEAMAIAVTPAAPAAPAAPTAPSAPAQPKK